MELKELETNLWTYDCSSVHEFLIRVDRILIEKYVPFKCKIQNNKFKCKKDCFNRCLCRIDISF